MSTEVSDSADVRDWWVCEYHGRVYVWTLRSGGYWSCGGPERYSTVAEVAAVDGPLKPADFAGSPAAVLATLAGAEAELQRLRARQAAADLVLQAVRIWRFWYPKRKGHHADNLAARWDAYHAAVVAEEGR